MFGRCIKPAVSEIRSIKAFPVFVFCETFNFVDAFGVGGISNSQCGTSNAIHHWSGEHRQNGGKLHGGMMSPQKERFKKILR